MQSTTVYTVFENPYKNVLSELSPQNVSFELFMPKKNCSRSEYVTS